MRGLFLRCGHFFAFVHKLSLGENMQLSKLKEGECAIVLHCKIPVRLQRFGLVPGTHVECVAKLPCGELSAYLIRGAVIAFRREDTQGLECELC